MSLKLNASKKNRKFLYNYYYLLCCHINVFIKNSKKYFSYKILF